MSDRLLAEAWRDLAGWHVGMVDAQIDVCTLVGVGDVAYFGDDPATTDQLPDLDSPANWGHWQRALASVFGDCTLSIDVVDTELGESFTSSCWVGEGIAHGSPAIAMLSAACMSAEQNGGLSDLPPSVLAWWKSQQGEVSGG